MTLHWLELAWWTRESLEKASYPLGVTAGADMWMWWTWDLARPPPVRFGNEQSRKLVKEDWWSTLTAVGTVAARSGAGGMPQETGLAA